MVGHRINLSQLITLASTAGGMNGYFMASIKDDDGTYRSTVAVPYVIPYRGDWPSAYQVQGSVNTF